MLTQKNNDTRVITPHLWFDKEAKPAAEFYTSLFPDSKISSMNTIHDTPSGDCDIASFTLYGQPFMAISAGPYFKINPSISFSIACQTAEEVNALWEKLLPGGKVLMEINTYPFSERYGWIEDKFGVSWQIISMGAVPITQKITPVLMFTQSVAGRAEEAMNFYTLVFAKAPGGSVGSSAVGDVFRYTKGQEPDKEGTVAHAFFSLMGQGFAAMDSAREHKFIFNEAVSFIVTCENQAAIDYYWEKLSAVPASEQCGWLKDKFGVSWQIVPAAMNQMMASGDAEKTARVTQAFLKMKKFDIATLEKAFNG